MSSFAEKARALAVAARTSSNGEVKLCVDEYYEHIKKTIEEEARGGARSLNIDRITTPQTIPRCKKLLESCSSDVVDFMNSEIERKLVEEDKFEIGTLNHVVIFPACEDDDLHVYRSTIYW